MVTTRPLTKAILHERHQQVQSVPLLSKDGA
jgi:hypothetical protein